MYDLLIKNGKIIDGTGVDAFVADVGIVGDTIAAVGDLDGEQAVRTIDAEGKVVTPGFIDPHSHNDLNMLIWPENEGNVMQGVTTAISGNCGFSPAPVEDVYVFSAWEYRLCYEAEPSVYTEVQFFFDLEKMKEQFKKVYDFDLDYKTLPEYFEKATRSGFSVNYYPFVGHNNIRTAVMGRDCLRNATAEELEKMKLIMHECMKAGARGLSTGLDYPPGCYATTEEIIELAKVAKEYGGSYITHFRSSKVFITGDPTSEPAEGIKEAIRIGRDAGIKVHLSHMIPTKNSSKGELTVEDKLLAATEAKDLIDEAVRDGVEITYDVIPNTVVGGHIVPTFAAVLKPWLLIAGSVEQAVKNLSIPEYADVVKKEMKAGKWPFTGFPGRPTPEASYCLIRHKDESMQGRTVKEIMAEKGWECFYQAVIDIFLADPYARMKYLAGFDEIWLKEILDHPLAMPSSDTFSYNSDSNIGLDPPLEKLPSVNNFCYAIRYLLNYGKERLEDSIYHMTGLPAKSFGIDDRGKIAAGCKADVVVLDYDRLATNEDYVEPRRFPDGVEYVIINGVITGDHKKHTGAKAGSVLAPRKA